MNMRQLIFAAVATFALAVSTEATPTTSTTKANAVTTPTHVVTASMQRCFPADFMFGSATAAYQVEGGWNETGRTPSIWDDFCREREGKQCANVADDFLHRYRDDIQLMVASGLDSFRFSISWSRVMNWDATTRTMKPNAPGIAFYHAVLDELRRNDITPILTLYHWDLPSELHHELTPRGWISSDIVDHFVSYADLMFHEFGAKVDLWTTFNEPFSFVINGYGTGTHAPGYTNSTTNTYTVTHHVLLAHAKAVQRFRALKQTGVVHSAARIGIVLVDHFSYPLDANNPLDVAAAERRIQFGLGWFLSPIVFGKYPDVMRQRIGARLPEFTPEEAAVVKGSYDLFMLNHYSSHAVTDCDSSTSMTKCDDLSLGWEHDHGVDEKRAPPGARLSSLNDLGERNCAWFTGYPSGYLEMIKWMHAHDPSAQILLTENGWCGNDEVENMDQLWYFQTYVAEVYRAITELQIPIIGYTAWSLMDNYEWGSFKPRFGLYYVNFTAETGSKDGFTPKATDLERIPRPAATWYAQLAKTKCLDDESVVAAAAASPVLLRLTRTSADEGTSAFALPLVPGLVLALVIAAVAAAVVHSKRRHHPTRMSTLLQANEVTPLVREQ